MEIRNNLLMLFYFKVLKRVVSTSGMAEKYSRLLKISKK
jgi:hypothetical protein